MAKALQKSVLQARAFYSHFPVFYGTLSTLILNDEGFLSIDFQMPYEPLHYAPLTWRENGEPFSPMFDDVYFLPGKALEESRYVFLKNNNLPQRWQEKGHFTIAELGFGTGANFLLTWQEWQETAAPDAMLHYIAFEKFPLHPDDLTKIHAHWPELAPYAEQLRAAYPPALSGFHRILLENASLTLVFGDVHTWLPQLQAKVDAWYLDGFAPGKNPEMWEEALFHQMAGKTASSGTFSTFTAAGGVRRGLQNAGFTIEKTAGFDWKREMLRGYLPHSLPTPQGGTRQEAPWFHLPGHGYPGQEAIVIGGGLAGTSAAYHLAKHGWQVRLIERNATLAQEASGNMAGIMMPLIAAPEDIVGQFYLTAYAYLLRHLPEIKGAEWEKCGVLQLEAGKRYKEAANHPAKDAGLLRAVTVEEANEIAGIEIKQDGLLFPQGGWVNPASLCHAYLRLAANRVETLFFQEAISLEYHENVWKVKDREKNTIASAPVVVVANAADAVRFPQCQWLPLRKIRGQTTYMDACHLSARLKTVLCHEGYVTPAVSGKHCVGATFLPDDNSTELRSGEHKENLGMLGKYVPEGFISEENISGKVGFRAGSPDRRPMVGMVPDRDFFLEQYRGIHQGKQRQVYPSGEYIKGLYVSVGHGSRGLVSTPLAGELLASLITSTPLPIGKKLLDALNPARFVMKEL